MNTRHLLPCSDHELGHTAADIPLTLIIANRKEDTVPHSKDYILGGGKIPRLHKPRGEGNFLSM